MFQFPHIVGEGGVDPLILIVTALLIEFVLGQFIRIASYPGHPAKILVGLLHWCDQKLNRPTRSPMDRAIRGILTLLFVLLCAAALGWAVLWVGQTWRLGWIAELFVLVIFLGHGQTVRFLGTVGRHLQRGNNASAKAHVAKISSVVSELPDEHAVVRAAIEWSSTRLIDATLGPVIWYALFGMPGLTLYLAVRITAQTIGYEQPGHQAFGVAARWLDGILNFIPIWLGGLFLGLASLFVGATSPRQCLITMLRYSSSHPLGSGGRMIAAMAGALTLSLGGPMKRDGKPVDAPWLGAGTARAVAHDLRRASYLLVVAGLITLIWIAAVAIIRIA